MSLESINPTTGEKIKSYPEMSPHEVEEILNQVQKSFLEWRKTSFEERSRLMNQAHDFLLKNKEEYAQLIATEMGKPIVQAKAEIEKCAWGCKYYAENAQEFLKPEIIKTEAIKSYVNYEPLGIVLAIMPWNFPFWQVLRFAVPALMAGNGAVLKHAWNVSGCALAIEEVFRKAGFPENIFRSLLISTGGVAKVIEHPLVKAVTLTGSTRAGQAVGAQAGRVLKKTVLELGGSDPFIVLEDADLEKAAEIAVKSRLLNTGQSCIAAKRFIVVEPLRKAFEQKLVEKMKIIKMGDPSKKETELGPMARADLRDELHKQVAKSVAKGAQLLLGGEIPSQKGAFYPPTIITGVKKGMPAYEEELFGPVASIIPVKDEEEAITVANDSPFGLGAAVFTSNLEKGEKIAARIEAGSCFINNMVRSDPRLPFGGIKGSGYGRELSHFGIREFVNIKTVSVNA
jgi:succinate-semialdehyde dehydrogenase/glutarate-semialdehyde dehydrogenase